MAEALLARPGLPGPFGALRILEHAIVHLLRHRRQLERWVK